MKIKKIEPILRPILYLIVVPLTVFALLCGYFAALHLFKNTGHLTLELSNISEIEALSGKEIEASFLDEQEESAAEISFRGNVTVKAATPFIVLDEEYNAFYTNQIELVPKDQKYHTLELNNWPGQTEFHIRTASDEVQSNGSVLRYDPGISDDYLLSIASRSIEVEIESTLIFAQSSYAHLQAIDCTAFIEKKGKQIKVRPAIWPELKDSLYIDFEISSVDTDSPLIFSTRLQTNQETLADKAFAAKIFAPSSFHGSATGEINWDYGAYHESQHRVNSKIQFDVAGQSSESAQGYLSLMELVSESDNEKRSLKTRYDTEVSAAEVGDHSLFPNSWSFVSKNWHEATVAVLFLEIVTLVLSKKKEQR